MKIGIDLRPLMTTPRTGVGKYTQELLKAIFNLDKNNQYYLYTNANKKIKPAINDWPYDNVYLIHQRLPNKILNSSIAFFKYPKINKLIGDPDIFFAPNLNFIALSKKTKYVLTVHDISFHFFPEFYTLKQKLWHKIISPKKQCQRADLIITPSENTKRDLINYYQLNTDKIKVIYPGITQNPTTDNAEQIEKIKVKYKLPHKYLLFLGTIEPRKNIIGLIEAFENLQTKHSFTEHLVIAGAPGWKNKNIFNRIAESPFGDKIHLINFVTPKDKATLYCQASIFIYPSFYEGFGFPILEAMSHGTPVITSNHSSLVEISGSSAYLIDPKRPEQITLAINNILTNKQIRDRQIEEGYKQIKKYTWEKSAQNWLATINHLASS